MEPVAAQWQWLSAPELEQATKGAQYALRSQSVRALRQQEVAERGCIQTAYPHHAKAYQTVIWKDQALTVVPSGELRLPCGAQRQRQQLRRPAPTAAAAVVAGVPEKYQRSTREVPEKHQRANLRRVAAPWRADHYEVCLTMASGEILPPPLPVGAVVGIALGEVHVAAVTTTKRHALVVSGRQ